MRGRSRISDPARAAIRTLATTLIADVRSWCGEALGVEPDALIGEPVHPGAHVGARPLPVRVRPAAAAFCTACEFCLELRT